MSKSNPRLPITLSSEEYEEIKRLASIKNISMSELCRQYIVQGLNGTITQDNIDFLVPVLRSQLKSLLDPAVERLAAISAKTCVQAGAAAYLSAEAILKFVPEDLQLEVEESYEAARKKAVRYLKGSVNLSDETEA